MGTRSVTIVRDGLGEGIPGFAQQSKLRDDEIELGGYVLVSVYRQYDGYPSGQGADIKRILNNGKVSVVNGFSPGQENPEFFNGMGCLAAYLVSHLKTGIGGIYLQPLSKYTKEEYSYTLYLRSNLVHLMVEHGEEVLYDGELLYFIPSAYPGLTSSDNWDADLSLHVCDV